MKKLVLLIFVSLFFLTSVSASEPYKKLDLLNSSEKQANKILYEFVLKDLNMTPKEIKDFARIEPQSIKAFEIDLNDDGINEIVGVVYSTLYYGTAGNSLFILQKQNSNYKNIAYILSFEPQKNVYVLNTKSNGYRDLKFYGSSAYKFKQFIGKYDKGKYVNDIQTKSLKNIFFKNK